jgi:hypothetical protein
MFYGTHLGGVTFLWPSELARLFDGSRTREAILLIVFMVGSWCVDQTKQI